MRFLVFSIIILLLAGTAFVYQEHRAKKRIESIEANLHDSREHNSREHNHFPVDAVTITKNILEQIEGIPAENAIQELDEFIESDVARFAELEHGLTSIEECCPEEELADGVSEGKRESKEEFWNRQEKELIEKHGDISEVYSFIRVAEKMNNRIQPEYDEYIEYLRALSILIPTPGNIEAYNQITEHPILPETFKIEFH